ncbi:MAG: [FeFe] hydrogenase H-cluster maturation GTPase HydF [Phascolarctobacterium sp.]|nr:[FeFe] hydrogenase H-cluster maturation GTPase HydF [Phascolarctobacterium sp.]
MSLNSTPSGERVHIGIFGKRNAGKSSLINAITSQNLAIVSEQKGTTTDPVYKAMELLPLGPVMIIDTPGIDDEGDLGKLRIDKAYQVLNKCHIVLLVVDAQVGITKEDEALWAKVQEKNLPAILVLNKIELLEDMQKALLTVNAMKLTKSAFLVSAANGTNIHELKEAIAALQPRETERQLVGDLINPLDVVILVTPIDSAAPKGRLILPQQQVLRDVLDHNAIAMVVQETELAQALLKLAEPPRLVITDSQAFAKVSQIVPPSVPLTSFSILMARYKGSLFNAVKAVRALDTIKDGDKILISEGCTHHRQCQDIGTVKMPNWIRQYTQAEPEFCFTSGTEFPTDLSEYKLVVHCGACMLNEKEMVHRNKVALAQGVPMTNYGIAIAYMHGILKRTVAPLPDIAKLLE